MGQEGGQTTGEQSIGPVLERGVHGGSRFFSMCNLVLVWYLSRDLLHMWQYRTCFLSKLCEIIVSVGILAYVA